jgi:hypothetical protein
LRPLAFTIDAAEVTVASPLDDAVRRRPIVNTCEMRFPGFDAARERGPIRWELFLHRDVRDVLLTARPDTLEVLYRGAADPAAWSATLREAGFPAAVFGTAGEPSAAADPPDTAA